MSPQEQLDMMASHVATAEDPGFIYAINCRARELQKEISES